MVADSEFFLQLPVHPVKVGFQEKHCLNDNVILKCEQKGAKILACTHAIRITEPHSTEPYRHVSAQKPNDNWPESEDCKGGGVRNTSSKERTGQTCLIKQDRSHAPERNHMQTIAEKHSLKDTS